MCDINDIVCELLEVFVHNVVHKRNLYPEAIFAKQTKYGIVVFKSIYPPLNDYISNVIKAIHFHLKESNLDKVYICFHRNEIVFERYVMDIVKLANTNSILDPLFLRLEQYLRSFMLKLQNLEVFLKPIENNYEFRIDLVLKEQSIIKLNDNPSYDHFPWLNLTEETNDNHEIIPIDQIKCDQFHLQFYIYTK